MIRDVYILRRTGEVITHKSFSKRGVDETIFSAFYQAISAFAEELGHGGIETISMGNVSFFYQHAEDLLFAIATDKNHDQQAAQAILSDVKERFFAEYSETLAQWNGDPIQFNGFTKVIEQVVTESQIIVGDSSIFSLPFALDGSQIGKKPLSDIELMSEFVLDIRQELATVHLLIDDLRRAGSNYKTLKDGCFEFLTKLLWPLWLAPSPDNRMLLIDGLHLIKPKVTYGFIPPTTRYEALLKADTSRDYIAVLEKLKEEIRSAAKSMPFDIHVLPADIAQLLRNLCWLANQQSELGVQLPSEVPRRKALKEAERFHAEAIQTYREAAEHWTKFHTDFKKNANTWTERIKTEIQNLEEHYDSREATVKEEIEKALTQLAKHEEAEKAEVDDWILEQAHKLRIKIKTSLKPFEKQFSQHHSLLEELLSDETPPDPAVERFLGKVDATLESFNTLVNEIRAYSKTTRKDLAKIQKSLDDLDREEEKRKAVIRAKFERMEQKERAKLGELQAERETRIQETRERLGALDSQAVEINNLIQGHIQHSEEQLATFEKFLLESGAPFPATLETPLYIPIYLAGLQCEDGSTELIVIPPIQVPDKRSEATHLGQREAPVSALAPPFITYFKTCLEQALAQDPKFAKLVSQLAPRHNLLTNSHVESLLYSGLHALWQSRLIPERTHTQVKLACIEAYRTPREEPPS